jgi:hypothetical protein
MQLQQPAEHLISAAQLAAAATGQLQVEQTVAVCEGRIKIAAG